MAPAEPLSSREIRQTVAAAATYLPADHAAYIRALPQDQFATVIEVYVALRSSDSRVPGALIRRLQGFLSGFPERVSA
jgi:hypothetical protein